MRLGSSSMGGSILVLSSYLPLWSYERSFTGLFFPSLSCSKCSGTCHLVVAGCPVNSHAFISTWKLLFVTHPVGSLLLVLDYNTQIGNSNSITKDRRHPGYLLLLSCAVSLVLIPSLCLSFHLILVIYAHPHLQRPCSKQDEV